MNEEYLKPTYFLDSDNPAVKKFAEDAIQGCDTEAEKAVALYYKVRDTFPYSPFQVDVRREQVRASAQLTKKQGYCVHKALLLAAAARAVGIPSRLQFFIVRNHLGTGEFEKYLETDLIVFHGAAQLYVDGEWRKVVPAFDKGLCAKLRVAPLEFDGLHDAVFQEYSREGGRSSYMETVKDYGTFADFPHQLALQELKKYYKSAFDPTKPMKDRLVFTDWD